MEKNSISIILIDITWYNWNIYRNYKFSQHEYLWTVNLPIRVLSANLSDKFLIILQNIWEIHISQTLKNQCFICMTLMLTVNVLDRLPTCNSPLKKPKTVATCICKYWIS